MPGRRQSGGRALRQTDGDGQPPPAAGGGSAAEELAGEAALRRHHRGRQDNGNEAAEPAEPAEVEEEEEDRKIMKRVGSNGGGRGVDSRPAIKINTNSHIRFYGFAAARQAQTFLAPECVQKRGNGSER